MINFILGVLFVVVCLPVLEMLTEVVQVYIEQYKAKCHVKIAKYNKEIDEAPKQPIGFKYESEE